MCVYLLAVSVLQWPATSQPTAHEYMWFTNSGSALQFLSGSDHNFTDQNQT